jgi:hypothetical protein
MLSLLTEAITLSDEAVKEFQEIYKKEFGEKIYYEDANKRGTELIELFRVIYRPIPPTADSQGEAAS